MLSEAFLLLWLYAFPADLLAHQAISLSKEGKYEQSEHIFKNIQAAPIYHRDSANFWHLLNNFKLNNKQESERLILQLEDSFTQSLPERHRVLVALMKSDLQQWKSDDLGDIARDMKVNEDRLVIAQGGPATQSIQQSVVDRLSKLIKQSEDDLESASAIAAAKIQGQQEAAKSSNPLDKSIVQDGDGSGTVDQGKLRKLSEHWGSLPPRGRARALQELTQGMDRRHRETVENYFRKLAGSQSK